MKTKTAKPLAQPMFRLEIEPLREGGHVATSPDLPGLVAQSDTIAQTIEIARNVARKIFENHLAHGDPLPFLKRRNSRKMVHAAVRRARVTHDSHFPPGRPATNVN